MGQRLAGLAIDRLLSAVDTSLKGIRRLVSSAITATALNCVRPVSNPSSATLACCVLSHVAGAMKHLGGHMAKIIEFYIPQSFHKVSKWLPPDERGKVLAFPQVVRKSA
jgi:hypothetical protein